MEQEKKSHKLKISFNSPVILGFVIICFGALLLNIITGGRSNWLLFTCWHSSMLNPLTYVRFVTHIFGHSSWSHLINNMTMLLVLGPMLEEKYGSADILIVIGTTAIVTGVIHYILFPSYGLLGASGVVFAFIILSSFTSFKNGTIPLTFILVSILYIGEQVFDALFVVDNVSNLTHIIGGAVGGFFGYIENKSQK